MTETELNEIFEAAVGVRADAITMRRAVNAIVGRYHSNESSVRRVLTNVRHMFDGEVFKSVLSIHDLKVVLGIFRDRYPDHLHNALSALRQHIEYYEGIRDINMVGARFTLDSFGGASTQIAEPVRREATRLERVIQAVEAAASNHPFGAFQVERRRLKSLPPSKKRIFNPLNNRDYAYHVGGQKELQFNLGIEGDVVRYGVAFSFEPSMSSYDIEPFLPRVRRFNDFFRAHPGAYADLTMWYYESDGSGSGQNPGTIPPRMVEIRDDNFVFLGKKVAIDELDIEDILDTFDALLPLYVEVEGGRVPSKARTPEDGSSPEAEFEIRPGCPPALARTKATRSEAILDVNLRHRTLQEALVAQLQRELGAHRAGAEQGPGGARIDVLARDDEGWRYYEIKTGGSARACIREALGQLLEYAYWGGRSPIVRLVVAGEPELDEEAAQYLASLRQRFKLPISYHQIKIEP